MKRNQKNLLLCILLIFNLACAPDPIEDSVVNDLIHTEFGSLPLEVIAPIDNPTTPEKIALGRALFWDPILSGNKDIACATCHHPNNDYAEELDLSLGVGASGLSVHRTGGTLVKRNSMTILNTAFNGIRHDGTYDPSNTVMFWDNRDKSLEEQALAPINSFEEMRGHAFPDGLAVDSVVARLEKISEYQELFAAAFDEPGAISDANIGKAIAAFERTLVANNSPFDRYARGESNALSELAIRGMIAFSDVGCANCHNGPMFSDFELHVLGVPHNDKLDSPDKGAEGSHQFRTPTLRNLSNTSPYMHNGTKQTLEEVLDFYDDAPEGEGISVDESMLDPLLREVDLEDGQEDAIIAFLKSLNDENFDKKVPERVPSGLNPGGDI